MTSVTLHLEDSMTHSLQIKAKNKGISIDKYIIYLLQSSVTDEQNTDEIDMLLDSMQFKEKLVPASESGKGTLSDTKYTD